MGGGGQQKAKGKKWGRKRLDRGFETCGMILISYFKVSPAVTSEGEESRGKWDEDILEQVTFKYIANL